MAAGSETYVSLRGGLTVPVEPLRLVFELQDRGFTLSQDGDALLVQPYQQLTPDDCRQIRLWKRHILALLTYEPPELA